VIDAENRSTPYLPRASRIWPRLPGQRQWPALPQRNPARFSFRLGRRVYRYDLEQAGKRRCCQSTRILGEGYALRGVWNDAFTPLGQTPDPPTGVVEERATRVSLGQVLSPTRWLGRCWGADCQQVELNKSKRAASRSRSGADRESIGIRISLPLRAFKPCSSIGPSFMASRRPDT
jgi:hypothetical protein